ncbi:EF-hand domain-containing protein [Sphingomonas azotifigens]|uniref:EF-hand domain-containing protein n=1 Tax=Sphingomonas azotifigens TaxID=330920 RepID=UPI000A03249D|nr:EF-hand domain-containing protein [Sphingomonas azotifigens]
MLTPLLFAAALQLTAPAPQTPAQPARAGQSPAPAADQAMPGTRSVPSDQPMQRSETPGAPPPATEAMQPTPRPDPAKLPVAAQFARFDANGDGMLDKAEYGSWLVALRTAKEAAFKADTPEAMDWIDSSFTATDADRDQKVSRDEWMAFLTPKAG